MGLEEPNLDAVIEGLDDLSQDFERILKIKLGIWARKVKQEQELKTPVSQIKGGALRQGARSKVSINNGKVIINLSNVEPYARYVEFGTGPVGQANQPTIYPEGLILVYRDTGWVYYDKKLDKFVGTRGLPARQFFYPPIFNHINELKILIIEARKEAVKKYLRSKK